LANWRSVPYFTHRLVVLDDIAAPGATVNIAPQPRWRGFVRKGTAISQHGDPETGISSSRRSTRLPNGANQGCTSTLATPQDRRLTSIRNEADIPPICAADCLQ
jgi:hypothetical protein